MATVCHVTSSSGLRKFQADGFLFDRVYILTAFIFKVKWLHNTPCQYYISSPQVCGNCVQFIDESQRNRIHADLQFSNYISVYCLRNSGEFKKTNTKSISCQVFETKIVQSCNRTNSDLCPRNMGAEINHNSETISLWEENSKKNIWAHKGKSNMESQTQWRIKQADKT
jgi:hypothetical protein